MSEAFIEEVRMRPVLWNSNMELYRDARLRELAWGEVAEIFGKNKIDTQNQWRKLRDSHRQAMFRRKTKSGQGAKLAKPWKYEKHLEFLLPTMTHRYGDSNIPSLDNSTNDDDVAVDEVEGEDLDVDDREYDNEEAQHSSLPRESRIRQPRNVDKVLKFLKDKQASKKNTIEPDDLDLFFASACKSTRKLPRAYQNRVKRELLDIISRAEENSENSTYLAPQPQLYPMQQIDGHLGALESPRSEQLSNQYSSFNNMISPSSSSSTSGSFMTQTGNLLSHASDLLYNNK